MKKLEERAEDIIKKHQEETKKRMSGKYSSSELISGEAKVRVVHQDKKKYVMIVKHIDMHSFALNFHYF